MTEKTKLSFLNSLEMPRTARAEVDARPKYFVTFPYAYMNGKLHLGHLFSFSKADFFSYYKELQGFNVLFPLGFHCTGIPISASARKLEEELRGEETDISTKAIIESMGFDDVRPFTDPLHWIRTFPRLARESLERFHSNIDWRRSFITTDMNRYYDSFIRWQFRRLREKGLLSFGKRYSIYCPIDRQMCLDHDRRKGENVKPSAILLLKLFSSEGTLLGRTKEGIVPEKLVVPKGESFVKFEYCGRIFFVEEKIYENLRHQTEGLRMLEAVRGGFFEGRRFTALGKELRAEVVDKAIPCQVKGTPGDGLAVRTDEQKELGRRDDPDFSLLESQNFVVVYEPEDEVISRSGGKCVVALLDQWYIDYSNPEWKEKVSRCLAGLESEDDTRAVLEDALEWVGKWGFSRSFGLGTRIPWDPAYLIDSLSDSTIYMAMYTVKHLLHGDLEGKEEIFPASLLSDDVWNFIFLDGGMTPELSPHEELLTKCRESFNYFYPVDLRVSGKDLLKNHLIFYLFNHVALFEEKHWPRRIYTNGHVLLNSEKMSKSSGNFMTVDDVLSKFGTSATRMCLAVCGDTNEDANFEEHNANAFVLRLYSFVKSIEELGQCDETRGGYRSVRTKYEEMSFPDKYLMQSISSSIALALEAHERMLYRDVVKHGFYEMIHARETYHILKGSNMELVRVLYKAMAQLLYPIIPSLSRHLINEYFDAEFCLPQPLTEERSHVEAVEHLKTVLKRILHLKRRRKCSHVTILVGRRYAEWKMRCMGVVDQVRLKCQLSNIGLAKDANRPDPSTEVIGAVRDVLSEYRVPEKRGVSFAMDYLHHPGSYSIAFDEYEALSTFKYFIEDNSGLAVTVALSDDADPLEPLFEFE
jgi:leucyl-tRNA synthetase